MLLNSIIILSAAFSHLDLSNNDNKFGWFIDFFVDFENRHLKKSLF